MVEENSVYIDLIRPLNFDHTTVPERCEFNPDLMLITSSAEAGVFYKPQAVAFSKQLMKHYSVSEAQFISIACAGLIACILKFKDLPIERCVVLCLEAPVDLIQQALEIAGLGIGAGSFEAQECAYVVHLSKRPSDEAIGLSNCHLFAREPAVSGTVKLAHRIAIHLMSVSKTYPAGRIVGFGNNSEWSLCLEQMVGSFIGDGHIAHPNNWITSVESGSRHFMTARPLLDILENWRDTPEQILTIMFLGAGGRLGVLTLCSRHLIGLESNIGYTAKHMGELDFACAAPGGAMVNEPGNLLYLDRRYQGLDNFFFEWSIKS